MRGGLDPYTTDLDFYADGMHYRMTVHEFRRDVYPYFRDAEAQEFADFVLETADEVRVYDLDKWEWRDPKIGERVRHQVIRASGPPLGPVAS